MRSLTVALATMILGLGTASVPAAEWRWLAEFTPESSSSLVDAHRTLVESRLEAARGVSVENVHWNEAGLDLHLKSGTIFLETSVEGYPVGAFFSGSATVSFSLDERKARDDMKQWLSVESLDAVPIREAFFFTLRGTSLLEQVGATGEGSVALQDMASYQEARSTMTQLGMDLVHQFLNRDGRSAGTAHVLFAPDLIRATGSPSAYLLYSYRPDARRRVTLSIFGNKDVVPRMPHRYYFYPVAWANPEETHGYAHGRASHYITDLSVGQGMFTAEETTTIRFKPSKGVYALPLDFNPRMQVKSITGADGTALPFLQWEYLKTDPNFDQTVLVAFPEPLTAGAETTLTVTSSGSLFEPVANIHWLIEEDTWHPQLDDPGAAIYELMFTIPKGKTAVASGDLLADEIADGKRRYHFKTPRPVYRTTMYFGDFKLKSDKADDTLVEVYVDAKDLNELKMQQFSLTEICNMVRFYNRRLLPLDSRVLRVTSTPTGHGRGFDGIILLAEGGFRNLTSSSDTFRAHEVAHQWWGNMVEPRFWPEDRWLSEGFADFMALEYYKIRYEGEEKLKRRIYEDWARYHVEPFKATTKNVAGDKIGTDPMEREPLINGTQNVYSKGPAVLHMLRYTFLVQKGDDEVFWAMLKDFLQRYHYKRASTADFIKVAEEHLGVDLGWFWDQWVYGRQIPEVTWSKSLRQHEKGWLLTVEASQTTDYTLVIPIYVHFGEDKFITRPLLLEGTQGSRQLLLPAEPRQVSLNDFYESLVRLRP